MPAHRSPLTTDTPPKGTVKTALKFHKKCGLIFKGDRGQQRDYWCPEHQTWVYELATQITYWFESDATEQRRVKYS